MGVLSLKQDIEERALRTGEWVAEHRATVRAAAKEFGVSKSTVHKDGGVIIRIEFQRAEKVQMSAVFG